MKELNNNGLCVNIGNLKCNFGMRVFINSMFGLGREFCIGSLFWVLVFDVFGIFNMVLILLVFVLLFFLFLVVVWGIFCFWLFFLMFGEMFLFLVRGIVVGILFFFLYFIIGFVNVFFDFGFFFCEDMGFELESVVFV